MAETTIASLEPRLQKQVESARSALDRGEPEQALELCLAVLAVHPDCLQVRRLERAAQLKFAAVRRSLVARMVTAVSTAPFLFSANLKLKGDPRSALVTAERLLRRDPQSVPALSLLGQSASALGWVETAVFAHEAASDLEPDRPELLVALGRAYLAVDRATDALNVANQALQLESVNPEALALMRDASVAVTIVKGRWEQGGDSRSNVPRSRA